MASTQLNGWKINYLDEGSGPPLLLIHGLLMDSSMFEPQAEVLRSDYRIIRPDLRNHGSSESRAEPHTLWDMMEDQIALLDHLGIERAVFGGVSQGGFQSIRAALKHPERVEALILIDSAAEAEDPDKAAIYESMAETVVEGGWNDFLLESVAAVMLGASASQELKSHWQGRWSQLNTEAALELMRPVSRRDDVSDRLSEIDIPALVIHGDEDIAITMDVSERLAKGLNTEVVRIPKAGHSATVENPAPVTEAMKKFLSELPG